MRSSPRGESSRFEVRCPRCDVSFPVETKICIHCGGPTGEAGGLLGGSDFDAFDPTGGADDFTLSTGPVEPEPAAPDAPFGVLREAGIFQDASRSEPANDRAYQEDAEPPGFVQTLMRSAGSFIWVALLIAFSLSRSCGN